MENKVILLVEDNPDDEELTIRTLKKNNILNDIIVAHDGLEALDYLFCTGKYKDHETNIMPAIIMLDIKLPKMSGLEVLKRIRADKRTKLCPVVMLTSSDEEKDMIESYVKGANSYVKKPVDFIQFQRAIKDLAIYWLLINKTPIDIGSQ